MQLRSRAATERHSTTESFVSMLFGSKTKQKPIRASTLDAERGEANGYTDTQALAHATSAPAHLTAEPSDILDSQATTVPGEDASGKYDNSSESDPRDGGLRRRVGTGNPARTSSEIPEKEEPEEKLRWGFIKHIEPKVPYTWRNQLYHTIGSSWLNILLICAPAGIAIYYAGVNGQIVFAVNFIAIIPLAAMLGFATEEIALRTGETLGGLINATFG